MATKDELQSKLKDKHGINKNISQALSREECENLLLLLDREPGAAKLIDAYARKNANLSNNNALYGRMRTQAEHKLETLQAEYQALETSIQTLEDSKLTLEAHKQQLEQEQSQLQAAVQALSAENQTLTTRVGTLSTQNEQLIDVNDALKRDNKFLKNKIDEIKLRLAIDTRALLQYEDNQIRKAVIRLFRWTLG
jgi:phage shock protein A